jgi:hypothetical protein
LFELAMGQSKGAKVRQYIGVVGEEIHTISHQLPSEDDHRMSLVTLASPMWILVKDSAVTCKAQQVL